MGTILIEQIEVETIIGVYEHERQNIQAIFIDIEMEYDSQKACSSDKIEYAIDYFQITEDIRAYVSQTSFQLIETLACAISDKLLTIEMVEKITIKISKPMALKNAKNVSFRMSKTKKG